MAVVALGMRLINWPFFYATLQSFIPDIDGAMCIFGVTQVCRTATGLAELVNLSFLSHLRIFLAHMIDHRTRTSPLMGRNLFFIGCASVVVILDSLLDVYLMLNIVPGQLVSCCTTVTDILDRATRRVPQLIFGPSMRRVLEYGYYASNILLFAVLGSVLDRDQARGNLPSANCARTHICVRYSECSAFPGGADRRACT